MRKMQMISLLMAAMLLGAMNFVTKSVLAAEDVVPVLIRSNTVETCNATPQERTAIMKAIEHYINAGRMGKSSEARKGFADTATMSWSENDALKSVPIKELYTYFDEKPRKASCEIVGCSVAGDIAMVRVESVFDDAKFTDMFTLVKDGPDWKIVSKVYHLKK